MIKLTLATAAFVLCLALPAAYAVNSKPTGPVVAKTILRQMNSGPHGRITKSVHCNRIQRTGKTFSCDLQSVISTHLDARVTLTGSGLRTTWSPIQG